MRTVEQLNEDIKYYQQVRDNAQKEGRFRTVEGAQQNIDRCRDKLYSMKEQQYSFFMLRHM